MSNSNVEYIFTDFNESSEADYGFRGAGWYFWDETGAYCHGPYESAKEAHRQLEKYCKANL